MISAAVQRGGFVYIYNERNSQCGCIGLNGGSLMGFTGSTVSIKRGGFMYVYNEKGCQVSCHSAR